MFLSLIIYFVFIYFVFPWHVFRKTRSYQKNFKDSPGRKFSPWKDTGSFVIFIWLYIALPLHTAWYKESLVMKVSFYESYYFKSLHFKEQLRKHSFKILFISDYWILVCLKEVNSNFRNKDLVISFQPFCTLHTSFYSVNSQGVHLFLKMRKFTLNK